MMFKQAMLLILVVGCSALLSAQTPTTDNDMVRLSGGVDLSTGENILIGADRADFNSRTGEILLFGTVTLRQRLRPAIQQIAATNQAGEPFPEAKQVMMRLRGDFQLSIGDLTVRAEEADVNGVTGEMTLRGNVRVTNPKWAGQKVFSK